MWFGCPTSIIVLQWGFRSADFVRHCFVHFMCPGCLWDMPQCHIGQFQVSETMKMAKFTVSEAEFAENFDEAGCMGHQKDVIRTNSNIFLLWHVPVHVWGWGCEKWILDLIISPCTMFHPSTCRNIDFPLLFFMEWTLSPSIPVVQACVWYRWIELDKMYHMTPSS